MVSVVIDNFPSQIFSDQFEIGFTINGAKSGTNYIRVLFYKDGTTNYFGETFNGEDWYKGSDGTQYFPIEIKSSSVSAIVKARIGDATSKDYPGSGSYKLKIKRYTTSGNAANDSENPVEIVINKVIETSTPFPTFTPEQLVSETGYITPKPTIILPPTPRPTSISLKSNTATAISQEVLSVKTETSVIKKPSESKFPVIPAFIFAFGLFCLGMGLFKVYNGSHASSFKKSN